MTTLRRRVARAAINVSAWTAAGLLIGSQTQLQLSVRGASQSTWSVFAPAMVGAWMWAFYTPLVVWIAQRLRRLRDRDRSAWSNWASFFALHLVVVAMLVVVDPKLWTYVIPFIGASPPPLGRVIAATLFFNVAAYLGVVTITEAAEFASRWRERERAAAKLARTADGLRAKLNEARLRALEGQLQPHFLYNTLNMAAELVYDEPDVADDMLTHLGALLRRSCREVAHVVPLSEEVSFVRAYAEILARRYRDRVTLSIDLPPALEQQLVPAFMLQPLVENAFRHGVEQREGASAVDVTMAMHDDSLVIRVRDRGERGARRRSRDLMDAGVGADCLEATSDGLGIRNIRERLAALYGGAAGMTLIQTRGETVAAVWIPAAPALAVGNG